MGSWIEVQETSDFSLYNLPYGVFSTSGTEARIGTAIGDWVLDLKALAQEGIFDDLTFNVETLKHSTLNAYAALEKRVHLAVRERLQEMLRKETKLAHLLKDNKAVHDKAFFPLVDVQMHLPMTIGDYTDFFVGLHHAVTCAGLVRPGQTIEQVCPCFYNMPIAYNGRTSSVMVSGTSFHRPVCQFQSGKEVKYGPSERLDIEVEFAAFVSRGNTFGKAIDVDEAEGHIFGFVLLNDWSARDIQFYEATLMGPFNGKGFCTTISPWIVTIEALEPFRIAPKETPRELPAYLTEKNQKSAYDIPIQATIEVDGHEYRAAECNTNNVIFSFGQMLAQHTRAGVPLRTGDLIATGTLSGEGRSAAGCFLEQSRGGKETYDMTAKDASEGSIRRMFCEDNDTIIFTAQARLPGGGGNVGFGKCAGKVLPAI